MTKAYRIEYLGWGFFGLVLIATVPIAIYTMYQITHDGVTVGTRVGMGIALAFIVTAFLSWAANALLQIWNQRQDDDGREDSGTPE
jgi:hypothetical protein